jgi:arylsulfatase A-like enzyme
MRRLSPTAGLCAGLRVLVLLGAGLAASCTPEPKSELKPERKPEPAPVEMRPNILVIDIDTFRADHLGIQREGRPVTPNMDALAARGTRFTQAYSQSGWTVPALVSNLTGVLPVIVSAQDGAVAWRPAGTRDLAEILGIYGYTTAAFWGNTLPGPMATAISPSFELNRMVQKKLPGPPTHEVTGFLSSQPEEPFFLYVHDIDLHNASSFETPDGRVPFDLPLMPVNGVDYQTAYKTVAAKAGEDVALDTILARYDGVIHLYDRAVGQILATLADAGLAERTVVVITSDHGEDFKEHSLAEHGLLFDTTLRVPLIVYDPQGEGGAVVDTLVQSVDLAPTLLERVGVPVDANMDGRSYLSLLGGGGEPYVSRPVFSLTEACHVSLRTETAKLIIRDTRTRADRMWQPAGGQNHVVVTLDEFAAANDLHGAPLADCSSITTPGDAVQLTRHGPGPDELAIELYDLVVDPGERTNLVAEQPETAALLLEPLLRILLDRRHALQGARKEPMSDEAVQALKDRGYWGHLQPGEGAPRKGGRVHRPGRRGGRGPGTGRPGPGSPGARPPR